jgi:protoporphyrinogen oxidase
VYTILGAGLSGISASFHLGHEDCIVYEKNAFVGGHIYSEKINGFTWDEGPHVSFTKNEYVKNLFAENTDHEYSEYPVETASYYHGIWIPHPAQSNLFVLPHPLKEKCFNDFLVAREKFNNDFSPRNYAEWLKAAFGETFYNTFPRAYTLKYWTVDPALLTSDWVGERVFYPDIEDVRSGYLKSPEKQTHYISKVRYPIKGGYYSYTNKIRNGMNVHINKNMESISFKNKEICFNDGSSVEYEKLIITIPLPELISQSDAPISVKESALQLSCSSVLLINITANHPTSLKYNWMYVYDLDKYCTRINCTELLSPENAPEGHTGIQVEVYFSKYKPITEPIDSIVQKVTLELIEMGILQDSSKITSMHTKFVKWANVIFDHQRKAALNHILDYLSNFGLERNEQDLNPMTNWDNFKSSCTTQLQLAGRFAEWKYYWTDDCIMRGKSLKG